MCDEQTNTPPNRSLKKGLEEIYILATRLDIPDEAKESAEQFYRTAVDEDLLLGQSIQTVASATLYAACRKMEIPRSITEFADVGEVSKTELDGTYRTLSKTLQLEITPTPPTLFVERYCDMLGLESQIQERAKTLINSATDENLHSGRARTVLAAGAIYAVIKIEDVDITQKEIATVTDASAVSIRNVYQDLLDISRRD